MSRYINVINLNIVLQMKYRFSLFSSYVVSKKMTNYYYLFLYTVSLLDMSSTEYKATTWNCSLLQISKIYILLLLIAVLFDCDLLRVVLAWMFYVIGIGLFVLAWMLCYWHRWSILCFIVETNLHVIHCFIVEAIRHLCVNKWMF